MWQKHHPAIEAPRFEWLYGKPGNPTSVMPAAWQSERLEYQFSVSNQHQDTKLTVDQYSSGSLDWYDFDIERATVGAANSTQTFIPAPVMFEGMPKPRWWEMEDGTVNFGDVNAQKTDLPTLLLLEFALIYGNDWLIVPYPMAVNTLCQIKGILVTDVFGCHTYIPPIESNIGVAPWEKWAMFRHGGMGATATSPWFYLAPTLLKSMESEPVESVSFLRDEMANLVWAFENIVPGAMGNGQKSREIAQQESVKLPDSPITDPENPLYYTLGTKVPFYQVPFLPVEKTGSGGQVKMRLQMGRTPQSSEPRGIFLREVPPPFYIREEEVSRSGIRLSRKWQRTRWADGAVFQWVGREKETGKGEGNSGLQFDVISHKPEYRPVN